MANSRKKMEIHNIESDTINVYTPEKFSLEIEKKVQEGLSYLESIMELIEANDVEDGQIKKLLTPNIIESLKQEAIELNIIRGEKKHKIGLL